MLKSIPKKIQKINKVLLTRRYFKITADYFLDNQIINKMEMERKLEMSKFELNSSRKKNASNIREYVKDLE